MKWWYVTWFLGSLVKQIKVFPPSKVSPGAVQEMLLPEGKSFLSQDHARFGFFCPAQSQRAMCFETHHMFWCHILPSLSSVLCTHHSVLTDCTTAFLLLQVFKLKYLKAKTIILRSRKTAWVSGTGLRAVVLPAQPRSLSTARPGAQGCLAE